MLQPHMLFNFFFSYAFLKVDHKFQIFRCWRNLFNEMFTLKWNHAHVFLMFLENSKKLINMQLIKHYQVC